MNETIYNAALRAGCPMREAQVLAMYVEHESAREVARALGLSVTTVTGHLGRAKKRLNVRHTAGVIAKLVA